MIPIFEMNLNQFVLFINNGMFIIMRFSHTFLFRFDV